MKDMLPITIYADSTGQFTEEECDLDNMVEIEVPSALLYQWWKESCEKCGPFEKEFTGSGPIPVTEDGFLYWLYNESTACETECDNGTLYAWLKEHGFNWTRTH